MTTRLSPSSSDDIHSLKALLLEKDKGISLLEEQVRLLKHKRFAASSEKLDGQTELFNAAKAAEPAPEDDIDENTDYDDAETETETETETIKHERRKSRGRKALLADLPRVRIEHDLSDADKVCECGCALG
jgi:transposase